MDTLPALLRFEHRLDVWEQHLEPPLRSRPWIEPSRLDPQLNATMERLGVILRLRYLHTCLLLHRTTLRALTAGYGQDRPCNNVQLSALSGSLAQQSLSSGLLNAVEIVQIVHEMSKVPSNLGSAWFSIYYSKLYRLSISEANVLAAFHAMLMLVKCLIFHFGHHPKIPGLPVLIWNNEEISGTAKALIHGREAIIRIGQGNGSSKRISKSLSRMFQACVSIGKSL